MIVKLAGTSGSGKSTFVRSLLALWKFTPTPWKPGKPKIKEYTATVGPGDPLYGVYTRVVVLGDYTNPCGGMDGVSDKVDRHNMVAAYTDKKFRKTLVVCEGLIFGGVYGITEGLGVLSEQCSVPWVYAFMDTPLELCLERCRQRRAARGVTEPMNPHNTTTKHQAVQCVLRRCKDNGHYTFQVNHKLKPAAAAKQLLKTLQEVELAYVPFAKRAR